VIPHTEKFLVEYKLFVYDAGSGYIRHSPSGMCVTPDEVGAFTHMRNCSSKSKWTHDAAGRTFKTAAGGCLMTSATSTTQLRVNVTVGSGASCSKPNAQWSHDQGSGMIQSGLTNPGPSPSTSVPWRWGASKLCLALRSEGTFNEAA
jgi:hypothetical protein